jgi:hypothetical protein
MKNIALLPIIILSLIACQQTSVDRHTDEIKYKETVTLNQVPKSTLTFYDVTDSRCPEGAQCIWAGNAVVDLELNGVTTEGGTTKWISMCLGQCTKDFKTADSLDIEFTGQKYRLILNAVNPYPGVSTESSKKDYSISLKIERRP